MRALKMTQQSDQIELTNMWPIGAKNKNTLSLYEGPSVIDDKPIVVLAANYKNKSANSKTGDMIQIFILRQDISPVEASNNGEDSSICGSCNLRPFLAKIAKLKGDDSALCYVNKGQSPNSAWKSWKAGNVAKVSPFKAGLMTTKSVRQGAYGDPAAVPMGIWSAFEAGNKHSGTSYTHRWEETPAMASYAMASIDPITYPDTLAAREEAHQLGFRTYRVVKAGDQLQDGEVWCPEKKRDANGPTKIQQTQCFKCGLCSGNRSGAKDIAIEEIT